MKEKLYKALVILEIALFAPFAILFIVGTFADAYEAARKQGFELLQYKAIY